MTETRIEMAIQTVPTSKPNSYWQTIFDKYDIDKDGYIKYFELKDIIESTKYGNEFPTNAVNKIMELANRDNSGYLDFEGFVDMMQNPDLKRTFGHYVDRYIHTIIPPRRYVQRTGRTYEEEYSCWPPPVYMIVISVLEIVLFSIDAAKGHLEADGDLAAVFIYDPEKRYEVWRFITYMLVHGSIWHISINLFIQLALGIPLELVHRWRVVIVYLAGGVAGSLITSLVDSSEGIAGASSGVYALCSAHIATIIMNWSEMRYVYVQLLVYVLLVVITIVKASAAYVPHLAGAVTGLLVGIGVLRNIEIRKWENRLWWVAVLLYSSVMITCILAHIFWTNRFPKQL